MNRSRIFYIIGGVLLIAAPLILAIFLNNPSNQPDSGNGGNGNGNGDGGNGNQNNQSTQEIYWGVDSASYTTQDLYKCVKNNYGKPKVWGRYLGTKGDVSKGLDKEEVQLLHENNVRILVIYNHFTDATGYDHGVKEAEQAIEYAKELGIPDGVAIFGDIEPSFPVTSAFMEGWYDALSSSSYKPGIYGVFDEGSSIMKAYNAMSKNAQKNTIVWSAFPQNEITTKENAPKYNPNGPKNAKLYGWQYAIEAEQCNIDNNLFRNEMLDYLW
ncbi:glycoside hydrolase domain-containing protein [Virgibacillus doumboii]|uniref:glycoside hydrolase domain-containing protein n=1 Tax=Virgibacillus doumboii TaxID=2697503 RepID=UPI0013DFD178|nr:glycoside hydrolase domain-containing protein [Virgibacillus doumboii]